MPEIKPPVLIQTSLIIVAAIALALITGDKTYLVGILIGLATGGAGAVAPPLPGVDITTDEATQLVARHAPGRVLRRR